MMDKVVANLSSKKLWVLVMYVVVSFVDPEMAKQLTLPVATYILGQSYVDGMERRTKRL